MRRPSFITGRREPSQAVTGTPARLSKRLAAFALDYVVILRYLAALTVVALGLMFGLRLSPIAQALGSNPWLADGVTFLTLVLPVALYFAVGESSPAQGTTRHEVVYGVTSLLPEAASPRRLLERAGHTKLAQACRYAAHPDAALRLRLARPG